MSDKECMEFAVKELVDMVIIKEKNVLDLNKEKVKKSISCLF